MGAGGGGADHDTVLEEGVGDLLVVTVGVGHLLGASLAQGRIVGIGGAENLIIARQGCELLGQGNDLAQVQAIDDFDGAQFAERADQATVGGQHLENQPHQRVGIIGARLVIRLALALQPLHQGGGIICALLVVIADAPIIGAGAGIAAAAVIGGAVVVAGDVLVDGLAAQGIELGLGDLPNLVHLGVGVVTGAFGIADVAVGENIGQLHLGAVGVEREFGALGGVGAFP